MIPRDGICVVIDFPLELKLRFRKVRYMLNDCGLATRRSRPFLFRFWRVNDNGRRFRPARQLVQRDVLGKVRAGRKVGTHYALRARAICPLARRSAPRNGRKSHPRPASAPCPVLWHSWTSQLSTRGRGECSLGIRRRGERGRRAGAP
jgi:hypothetical protein